MTPERKANNRLQLASPPLHRGHRYTGGTVSALSAGDDLLAASMQLMDRRPFPLC